MRRTSMRRRNNDDHEIIWIRDGNGEKIRISRGGMRDAILESIRDIDWEGFEEEEDQDIEYDFREMNPSDCEDLIDELF